MLPGQLHSNPMKSTTARQSGNKADSQQLPPAGKFLHRALSSVSWLGWRAVAAVLGGIVLRLWMRHAFPQPDIDAQIYGDMARNLLQHGQFAVTASDGSLHSTIMRLPGYPLFIAAVYALFGVGNLLAVFYAQIAVELGACLLLADFVRRTVSLRAGYNTLWIATLCPFTAIYTGAGLAESVTISAIMAALWALQRHQDWAGIAHTGSPAARRWALVFLLLFTAAISFAALARPDGALVAVALWPALLFSRPAGMRFKPAFRRAILCGLLAVSPFAVWTVRNWQVFHIFEPLAPRYATDPGEPTFPGWERWTRSWCLDFTCTYEVYWNGNDDLLDFNNMPAWAFDSPDERARTAQLFADYNLTKTLSDDIDARFGALADERNAHHPWRTHLFLPIGRFLDMAFRPRVENMPIDLHWWEYSKHYAETRFSYAYGALNLLLYGLAIVGIGLRPRYWPYMAAYILMRSLMLLDVEAPECRYTLEFFPVVFALAGPGLWRIFRRKPHLAATSGA